MNNIMFVSFYTKKYKEIVKFLKSSLEWLKLPNDIIEVKENGTWSNMTWYKPEFLLQMYHKHKKPIFWIDADAAFIRYPKELYENEADFSICYDDELHIYHPVLQKALGEEKRTYHSGSMLINHKGIKIIEDWLAIREQWINIVPDQYVINLAVNNNKHLQLQRLSYDYINTLHVYPYNCGPVITTDDPVIMHFIFSDITDNQRTVSKAKECSLYSYLTKDGYINARNIMKYKKNLIQIKEGENV
jgi:hypothetical protein